MSKYHQIRRELEQALVYVERARQLARGPVARLLLRLAERSIALALTKNQEQRDEHFSDYPPS